MFLEVFILGPTPRFLSGVGPSFGVSGSPDRVPLCGGCFVVLIGFRVRVFRVTSWCPYCLLATVFRLGFFLILPSKPFLSERIASD